MRFAAIPPASVEAILSAFAVAKRFAISASERPEAESSTARASSKFLMSVESAALSDSCEAARSATFTWSMSFWTFWRASPMPK